jgi:hypothetical protein
MDPKAVLTGEAILPLGRVYLSMPIPIPLLIRSLMLRSRSSHLGFALQIFFLLDVIIANLAVAMRASLFLPAAIYQRWNSIIAIDVEDLCSINIACYHG